VVPVVSLRGGGRWLRRGLCQPSTVEEFARVGAPARDVIEGRVVRIFPNPASCLRLVRALCAETHEGWLEDHRYLNMDFWKEQKKDLVRVAAW